MNSPHRRILAPVNVYFLLQEQYITPATQLGVSCTSDFLPERTVGEGGKECLTRGETDA